MICLYFLFQFLTSKYPDNLDCSVTQLKVRNTEQMFFQSTAMFVRFSQTLIQCSCTATRGEYRTRHKSDAYLEHFIVTQNTPKSTVVSFFPLPIGHMFNYKQSTSTVTFIQKKKKNKKKKVYYCILDATGGIYAQVPMLSLRMLQNTNPAVIYVFICYVKELYAWREKQKTKMQIILISFHELQAYFKPKTIILHDQFSP